MALEDDVAARLEADSTLMAILDGGVYTAGDVGLLGITRESAPSAFDANGYLEPAALVRQRGNVPDNVVRDGMAQKVSATQVVEIYIYQDSGYDQIDLAVARIIALLEGYTFAGAFPAELSNIVDRQRDTGALNGASLARLDFAIYNVITV